MCAVKKWLFPLLMACALLLTACQSVSEDRYEEVCAQRDALLEEKTALQASYEEACAQRDALAAQLAALQPAVFADYGDSLAEDDCDRWVLDDSEYQVPVAFTAARAVENFRVLGLTATDGGGTVAFTTRVLYSYGRLEPERPFVLQMTFVGELPNVGISYEDNGVTVTCGVVMSGEDGSILLVEI